MYNNIRWNLVTAVCGKFRCINTNLSLMQNSVFWDKTSCSPLKVNRRFGGTYRLHLQSRIISRARYRRKSRWQAEICFRAGFLFGLFFDTEDGGGRLTFNGLHGVISQKIELFITTSVGTSKPVASFPLNQSYLINNNYRVVMCGFETWSLFWDKNTNYK
jgi:hypothetical protein